MLASHIISSLNSIMSAGFKRFQMQSFTFILFFLHFYVVNITVSAFCVSWQIFFFCKMWWKACSFSSLSHRILRIPWKISIWFDHTSSMLHQSPLKDWCPLLFLSYWQTKIFQVFWKACRISPICKKDLACHHVQIPLKDRVI